MRAALLVVVLSMGTAGCAFEGQIAVQQVTTRAGQVVKVDCSVTGIFDVREATGSLCSSSSTSST
ncbi:MAG: hypothetical protein E6G18_10110 [Actinobacteria bacterium]|nr:MAG: hypothetical protein E6G18_10110 [Actinomycetota bacterium]